jgi:cell division protein FtsW (lipid II flippase)
MPAPNIYQNITKKIDIVTLLLSAALAFIGLISIYSATIMSDPGLSHFNKQLIISTIGLFISVMISLFSVKIIKNGSMYFFIAMIFLLILVKFIGRTEAGTTG